MSTDSNSDFDVKQEANTLRRNLREFAGVEAVSAPQIREDGEGSQYVSFGVTFEDTVDNPDIKFENDLGTFLSLRLGSKHDWWLTNDMPGYYGVVNTYGLNPSPESNIGAHTQ